MSDRQVVALDDEQRAAVESRSRRVRVIAGPGSGKTRSLTERARWLIYEKIVAPNRVGLLTFTRRASGEIGFRLREFEVGDVQTLFIGTIHSLGARILLKSRPAYRIANEGIRRKFLRRVLAELKSKLKFKDLDSAVSRWKRYRQPPPPRLRAEVDCYQRLLTEEKLFDFDDLILRSVELLESDAVARTLWQERFDALLVDEAQDTTTLEWEMIGWLLRPDTYFFVVGDPAQCIYEWRGARPKHFLNLHELFGEEAYETFPIATNYRSRPVVVSTANVTAGKIEGALAIRPAREDHPFVMQVCPDGSATAVVAELKEIAGPARQFGEMAVLSRTHSGLEPYERACIEQKVPYILLRGMHFYARREVMDVLAYLQLAVSWEAVDALERIYNVPSRYLGRVWHEELMTLGGWPAFVQARGKLDYSRRYMVERGGELYGAVRRLQRLVVEGSPPVDVVGAVVEGLGYREWLVGEEGDADEIDQSRSESLDQLADVTKQFKTVSDFLDFAELIQSKTRALDRYTGPKLSLSTVHGAKGLEWPVVVVAGLEQGHLPHRMGPPEEERRIFYVAVTRARDRLLLVPPEGEHVPRENVSEYLREVVEAIGVPIEWEAGDDGFEEGIAEWDPTSSERSGDGDDDAASDPPVRGGGPVVGGAGVGGADDGVRPAGGTGNGALSGGGIDVAPAGGGGTGDLAPERGTQGGLWDGRLKRLSSKGT